MRSSSRLLARLFSGAGRLEILVLVLGIAIGLVAGLLFDNFIIGFLALAVLAGIGRLLLGLFGPNAPRDGRQSTTESRERQHAHS